MQGIAILSRFPIIDSEVVHLPFFETPLRSHNRIALIARVRSPHGVITVCNVHLDVRINVKHRIEQIDYALERLKNETSSALIVGGDFNTSPFHFALRMLPVLPISQRKRVHAHMCRRGFTGLPKYPLTYRPAVLPMKLDHIYAAGATIERCGVEKNLRVSDHRPVWADIAMA